MLMASVISDNLRNAITHNMSEGMLKSWLDTALPEVFAFFWAVILAFVAIFICTKVGKIIRKGIMKGMDRRGVEHGVKTFVDSMLNALVWIVAICIVLGLFGITATSIAAAVASLGVTAGLALQGSLSNFAGGVLILVLHPFRVGDYIIEDSHKNEGTVIDITIFYTKLRTIDNKIIVIPNGALANNSLTNATKSDRRMVDLKVSIGYDDDIRKAKELLRELIMSEDRRLKEMDTEVKVFVSELGESAVELGVRFWVPTDEYWAIRWKMLEDVKYIFDENDITIPYNQMDVTIKNVQEKD